MTNDNSNNSQQITIIPWYLSKSIWLNAAGIVTVAGTLALGQIGLLGLQDKPLFYVSLGLTILINIANIFQRNMSNDVISSKKAIGNINSIEVDKSLLSARVVENTNNTNNVATAVTTSSINSSKDNI